MTEPVHYFSGMDPKDIKDPVIRKEYEATVAEHLLKATHFDEEFLIRSEIETGKTIVADFLKTRFKREELPEADRLIETHLTDSKTNEDLRKAVKEPGKP